MTFSFNTNQGRLLIVPDPADPFYVDLLLQSPSGTRKLCGPLTCSAALDAIREHHTGDAAWDSLSSDSLPAGIDKLERWQSKRSFCSRPDLILLAS
ncbi:MAG: hypothetical protein ACOCVG_02575 [Verrucomicrobiota bacterium]